MSNSYYPGSRKLFQAPLSNSILLSFLASSNWKKKGTPPPWSNLWLALFFPDPSPVFTRFLGKNAWARDEVLALAFQKFFQTLKIKARSVVFLLLDNTIIKKTGKKIPGCAWYRDHAQNLLMSLATNGFWRPSSIKRLPCPWGPASTIPKGQRDAHPSRPKSPRRKGSSKICACPWPANSMFRPIAGTGVKNWLCFA